MRSANPQSTVHSAQCKVHSPQSLQSGGHQLSTTNHQLGSSAFTLLEVMIACGIFFMATFAILALVAGTLRNARNLQRGDVDAGMAAAQIVQMLKTNRQADVRGSGDFGEAYRDFSYEFQSGEYMTNGLLQVDIIVNRFGAQKPVDTLTIWIYAPDAKSGYGARL